MSRVLRPSVRFSIRLVFCLLVALGISAPIGAEESAADPSASRAAAAPFEFALIGDYPYFPRDDAGWPHLLADLRQAEGLDWVLHLGDIHNPRATACRNDFYETRREDYRSIGKPFLITPGDNDWSDCNFEQPLWLERFRSIFYPEPTRVMNGPDFAIRVQSRADGAVRFEELVENAMWRRGGVVFATLHLVTSPPPWTPDASAEVRAQLRAAALVWMEEAFRVAEETDARGVFLAMQANLWPWTSNPKYLHVVDPEKLEPPRHFEPFVASLVARTRRFGRPVVVANGDTHTFRIDKPLVDEHRETLQNFTRVEGFGSPHGHWVRVRVEPDREEVFSFRQEWVPENLYTLVPRAERQDGFEDDSIGWKILPVRILQWLPPILMVIGGWTVLRVLGRFGLARLRGRRG